MTTTATSNRALVRALSAVPLLISLIVLYSLLPELSLVFSPRCIIYSNQVAPLFLAPLAWPENPPIALSRLLQGVIILFLDDPIHALGISWIAWVGLALIRTGSGYLLTRSVGWAYPALFSHWALYETSSGIGAALLGYLIIVDPAFHPVATKWMSQRWFVPTVVLVFCWLECRPWTYGTAMAFAYPIAWLIESGGPFLPKPVSEKRPLPTRPTSTFLQSAAAVLVPWMILYHLVPPSRFALPDDDKPLVDIVMLSFPRPVPTETSYAIINSSISSYLPFLSPAVSLSLFTHATAHEALEQVYRSLDHPSITLHVDTDSHPDDHNGQYLHIAEAFRWIMEDAGHKGEWVMLVEDDFTVCNGQQGWEVITTVINKLESDRQKGLIRSGFVGTGGSGLIIHRSYLPSIVYLLRTLAQVETPLHTDFVRRLPDQIVQDCLIGRPYSFCQRNNADQTKTIITSRLVLDHIGGMATTTAGKPGNMDKWRCGWRHAFHGNEQVEVVVV